MGQKPAQLEREIAARRSSIEDRIHGINERVRHDLESIEGAVKADAEALKRKVPGAGPDAPPGPDAFLRDHPTALLAAGVGAGFLLDRMFAGDDDDARPRARRAAPSRSDDRRDHGEDGGTAATLKEKLRAPIAALLSQALDSAMEEGRRMVTEATHAAGEKVKETVKGTNPTPVPARPSSASEQARPVPVASPVQPVREPVVVGGPVTLPVSREHSTPND